MHVAVIGAGGYIGSRLGPFLQRRGMRVDLFSSKDRNGIDPISGKLRPGFALSPGTDVVVYLAQSPFYRAETFRPRHLFAVNVWSALRVAAVACRAGVKRFLYASSGNVYAPSFSPLLESSPVGGSDLYGRTKRRAESALKEASGSMEVTSLRLFGVFGPGQTDKLVPGLHRSVREGKIVTLERNPARPDDSGGTRISLCYIDDLLPILAAVIEQGGPPVINVAGPTAFCVSDIVRRIGSYLKRPVSLENSDRPRARDLIADISRLRTEFAPSFTPPDSAFAATLAWLSLEEIPKVGKVT